MKRTIALVAALAWVAAAVAQTHDFGFELGASAAFKPWKGGEVALSEELRFKDNCQRFAKWENNVTVQQGLFRRQLKEVGLRWRVGAGYSFIERQNSHHVFYSQHRLLAQTSLSKDWGLWRVRARLRVQTDIRNPHTGAFRDNPQSHLRFRLAARYALPSAPWQLEMSGEGYYRFADPKGDEVDKWRAVLSATHPFNRHHSVTLFGKLTQEVQAKNPETFFCLGVSYQFD